MSSLVQNLLRRGALVALGVGLTQAVVVLVGWYFLYQSTHKRVAHGVEEIVLEGNSAAARSIVDALGTFPNGLEFEGEVWERAQSVVESLELGGDGFACILDQDGFIVCHPEIRANPDLRNVRIADDELRPIGAKEGVPVANIAPGEVITGTMEFAFDGQHYVSSYRDTESGVQVLVHQPVSGLTAAGRKLTSGLLAQMLAIGATICTLTALLGYTFTRAHNREVIEWNLGLEARVHAQTEEIVRAHHAIIFGIAKLSEYRDNETGLHVERMCAYSGVLARELRRQGHPIDEQWITDIQIAASLHDIGKVAIQDAILLKPGRLTAEEFKVMQTHVQFGEEALRAVRERTGPQPLLDMGIDIARAHHERWDGTGYPNGLAGEDIPLAARIVAMADVFDALMSKRVYKSAMPFAEVERIMTHGCGSHFDPAVVAAFDNVKHELCLVRERLMDGDGPHAPLPAVEDEVTARLVA